jgi:hypothetical protein
MVHEQCSAVNGGICTVVVHKPRFLDDSNYVGLNWFIDVFIGINTNGLNFNEIMLTDRALKSPKSNPVSKVKIQAFSILLCCDKALVSATQTTCNPSLKP